MDQAYADALKMPQPANLVGTWRRFGAVGPVYEIISAGTELPDGDRLMRIRVVETGEEVDYSLAEILDDPRERGCLPLPFDRSGRPKADLASHSLADQRSDPRRHRHGERSPERYADSSSKNTRPPGHGADHTEQREEQEGAGGDEG